MRFRLYDAYMLFRMADIASRRRRRGRVAVRQVRPLTDKQIAKNYRKATHKRLPRPKHYQYSQANGRVVGIGFLLLLIVFLLLTIIVNMPVH